MIHNPPIEPFEFSANLSPPTNLKNVIGQHHQQFNLLHVSQTFDPTIFRKTVQAKIKQKYQHNQSKHFPKKGLKTLQVDQSEVSDRKKRLMGLRSQTVDKSQAQEEPHHFTLQARKTNSLQKLLNKKHHIFLNTSNLFSPSIYVRQRKSVNHNVRGQLLAKAQEKSQYQAKYSHLYQYNKVNSFNYGKELGKSTIYYDDAQHSKTAPEETEITASKKYLKNHPKGDLYRLIKNSSPMNIRKNALKEKQYTELAPRNELMLTSPNNLSLSKVKTKIGSQRRQSIIQSRKPSRNFPKSLKIQQTVPTSRQKEDISGWAYDEQY